MLNLLRKYLYLIAISLTLFAFLMYWGIVGDFKIWEFSKSGNDWSNFGSYAGGIFAALAFLVVVYQNYQRDEEQKKQDFERTFFMMLEQHNSKLTFLESKDNGEFNEDEKVNRSIVDTIYNQIITNRGSFEELRKNFEIGKYHIYYSDINVYFLNLYRLLKFTDKNIKYNNNNEYSSLLRSFISRKLIVILVYHLCKREEDPSYKDYINFINKFSFLEHVDLVSLEVNFIANSVEANEEFIFDILNNLNDRDFNVIKDDIEYHFFGFTYDSYDENKDPLPRPIEAQRVELLQEIIAAKKECKELEFENNSEVINANFYDYKNIFIYMLSLFDELAFKNNIFYRNMYITYRKFIEEINKQEVK